MFAKCHQTTVIVGVDVKITVCFPVVAYTCWGDKSNVRHTKANPQLFKTGQTDAL